MEDDILDKIKDVIKAHPGKSPVYIDVSSTGQSEYVVETAMRIKPDLVFFTTIEKLLGPECLELKS
jgi:hypothetical protein